MQVAVYLKWQYHIYILVWREYGILDETNWKDINNNINLPDLQIH